MTTQIEDFERVNWPRRNYVRWTILTYYYWEPIMVSYEKVIRVIEGKAEVVFLPTKVYMHPAKVYTGEVPVQTSKK